MREIAVHLVAAGDIYDCVFLCCPFFHEMSRMRSWTKLSQFLRVFLPTHRLGWSGGAMVLGKLPVPGRPTIWITVGQGSTALAVGAGGGYLDIFTLIYPFSPLSPALWGTARYRLKYRLKGPLSPKQPTNLLIGAV